MFDRTIKVAALSAAFAMFAAGCAGQIEEPATAPGKAVAAE